MASERLQRLLAMLETSPNDPFLLYGVALEQVKLGATEEGIRRLTELIAQHPDYHAAYFQLGQTLLQEGEAEQARHWLEKGIAVAQRLGQVHAASEMEALLLTI